MTILDCGYYCGAAWVYAFDIKVGLSTGRTEFYAALSSAQREPAKRQAPAESDGPKIRPIPAYTEYSTRSVTCKAGCDMVAIANLWYSKC